MSEENNIKTTEKNDLELNEPKELSARSLVELSEQNEQRTLSEQNEPSARSLVELNEDNDLIDQVSTEYLIKATTISPCGHIFNQNTISKLVRDNKPCPACRGKIEQSIPCYTIRNIVEKKYPDSINSYTEYIPENDTTSTSSRFSNFGDIINNMNSPEIAAAIDAVSNNIANEYNRNRDTRFSSNTVIGEIGAIGLRGPTGSNESIGPVNLEQPPIPIPDDLFSMINNIINSDNFRSLFTSIMTQMNSPNRNNTNNNAPTNNNETITDNNIINTNTTPPNNDDSVV